MIIYSLDVLLFHTKKENTTWFLWKPTMKFRSWLKPHLNVLESERSLPIWNTNHSSTSERIKPTDLCIFGTMLLFFFSKNLLKSHGSKESYFNDAKESSPYLWSAMIWACYSKWYETWGLVHPAPSSSDGEQACTAVVDGTEAESRLGDDYKLRGKKHPKQREDGQRLETT